MNIAEGCRTAAGVLVLLIGAALGFGGTQLWRGGPAVWPDIIASAETVRRTSVGVIAMAVLLLLVGGAVLRNMPWGGRAAAIALLLFLLGGFWANALLFGDVRPMHTATNVVVSAIIVGLLWFGYAGRGA